LTPKWPRGDHIVRSLTKIPRLRSGIASDLGIVEVLAREPDLAIGLSEAELEGARSACRARTVAIARGDWDPGEHYREPDGFGLFLLSGFVVRRVGRGGRFGAELLGPGDLLRPWQTVGPLASRPFEPVWSVVAKAEVALLDAAFARRAAPFPAVAVQLVDRAMLRSRHLALALAIVQQPRVDHRLHWLFWGLADRWGRTGSDGVRVELPLTHSLLGELVAARRPSVTTALTSLAAEGKVERDGGSWLLRGAPPADYADLAAR
jgi:CRP/FNR family transcriptional regulator, cyclic AMP receptor protein